RTSECRRRKAALCIAWLELCRVVTLHPGDLCAWQLHWVLVTMSTGRPNTSSKRKKSTPKKFKSRKLFASSGNDLSEEAENSISAEESKQEGQLSPSKLPTTPQNKENVPANTYGSGTVPRGRGRPKGSKNKTFPSSPTRVYAVREVKSPVYHSKTVIRSDSAPQNRGRGRPKGSTKVKAVVPDGPKRSRGRPKGSKNKKPSKASLLKKITSGQKLGRGRPRKNPETSSESLTPKRGRGRPKGSLNKLTYARRVQTIEPHIEEEVVVKEVEEVEEEEEETDNDDNESDHPVSAGPGVLSGMTGERPSSIQQNLEYRAGLQESNHPVSAGPGVLSGTTGEQPSSISWTWSTERDYRRVTMNTAKSGASAKRKRSTPKKFKCRKLFGCSGNDPFEAFEFSRPRDQDQVEKQFSSSKLPTPPQKKEYLYEHWPSKSAEEDTSEKYTNGSAPVPRKRERTEGSKNQTYSASVCHMTSSLLSPKREDDWDEAPQNRVVTPHRGRGRPKGSTKMGTVHHVTSPVNSPKREGDRDGTPQNGAVTPHRGRGRPKGSTKADTVRHVTFSLLSPKRESDWNGTPHNADITPHRGRGRPKGSTKAGTVRHVTSSVLIPKREGDRDSMLQYRNVTPHRGRGRPKGSTKVKPVVPDVPKRSRGRPKGSKNKKPSLATLLKMLSESQQVGRGRPRKILQGIPVLTPKRGRGRPKGSRNKVPSAKKIPVLLGTHEVKKRGRPRKLVLHSTNKPLTPKRPRGRPKTKGLFPPVPSTEPKSSESSIEDEDKDEDEEGSDIDE
ncbi:serine/arginine repetitive matrix protein 5-like, partial [Hyperolius riggenbachi]|uniref:serine/arginine repetitive matrix protein 5-like n=1 Tax=Hyperolius riggenbachi TaxID=752182 RepID=UPI0035A355E9